jgi:hypothetical protein
MARKTRVKSGRKSKRSAPRSKAAGSRSSGKTNLQDRKGNFIVPRKTMPGLLALIDRLDSLVEGKRPGKGQPRGLSVSWSKNRYCCKFHPQQDPRIGETTFECWNHRTYPVNADLRCVAHALARGSDYASNTRGRYKDEGCRNIGDPW